MTAKMDLIDIDRILIVRINKGPYDSEERLTSSTVVKHYLIQIPLDGEDNDIYVELLEDYLKSRMSHFNKVNRKKKNRIDYIVRYTGETLALKIEVMQTTPFEFY